MYDLAKWDDTHVPGTLLFKLKPRHLNAGGCASVAWANNRSAANRQILAVLRDPNNADATTGFSNLTKQLNAVKCAQASFALSVPSWQLQA